MSRSRLVLAFATAVAAASVSATATAQTITATTPTPDRLTPAGSAAPTRPANFNPLGISYSDCTADMTLRFTMTLASFPGSVDVQVWASPSSYCVAQADRGLGGSAPVCWAVSPRLADPTIGPAASVTFDVRVQDLVGWQSAPPTSAQAASPPTKGPEACSAQPTFAAVPMNINFLPVDGQGNAVGTPFVYQINTDLVGPGAPSGMCETVGDTVYNLQWQPNADSDTVGYALFIDPIPGQEPAPSSFEAGTGLMPADAGGCGNAVTTASCNDPVLASAIVATGTDAGTGGAEASADAGADADVSDDGSAVAAETGAAVDAGSGQGPAGISTIPTQYIYKATNGITLTGASTSSYTIQGLVNYVPYTVVLAAVDGSGNIGPASPEVCDYPAPIQDYWQVYEGDGGGKGGFCALESVGVGGTSLAGIACALGIAGVVRRRRRRR